MRLHLVDGDVLLNVLEMDWNILISKVHDLSIRELRPKLDPKLNRDFDIDCDMIDNIEIHELAFRINQMYFMTSYNIP